MKRTGSFGFLTLLAMLAAFFVYPAAAAAAGTWEVTGAMNAVRYGHTATLLPGGQVLVAGGIDDSSGGSIVLSTAELYDPTGGSWSYTTGSMHAVRFDHTATLLNNGKILVAGGCELVDIGGGSIEFQDLDSAELYDPATGTWEQTGSLAHGRYEHTATLLDSGKVLVAGGSGGIDTAELYDPATGTWSDAAPMGTDRSAHTATRLADGTVLVAGGIGGSDGVSLASAEIYDPLADSWTDTTGSMSSSRSYHSATLLEGGKVLVAGGRDDEDAYLDSAEAYDPATGIWSLTGAMGSTRAYHAVTLLENGDVLVAGGDNGDAVTSSAELYDATTGAWISTGSMTSARSYYLTAVLLQNGRVLVAGGIGDGGTTLSSAELYTPGEGPAVGVKPATAQFSDCVSLEATVTPPGSEGCLSFRVNNALLGLLGCPRYDATSGAGSQKYLVWQPAGNYPITARFSPEETTTAYSGEATLTVTPEAMTVTPDPRNPTSLAVPWAGKPSGTFVLKAAFAQERDGCYGLIAGTLVTCTITVPPSPSPPLGARTAQAVTYTRTTRLLGLPGPLPVTAAFVFNNVPACTYDVRFSVDDGRYQGQANGGQLVITQPPVVFQKWVEPKSSTYRVGQTVKVAFLLKYGVSTDQAYLTMTGPDNVVIASHEPFTYDGASGQHRFYRGTTWGVATTGLDKGLYTLRVDLPNGTSQYKTIRLK